VIRFACSIVFAVLAGTAGAQSVKLSSTEIEILLSGNTAVGEWEGTPYRQYFDPNGVMIVAQRDQQPARGHWRVTADEYQSRRAGETGWQGWFVMECRPMVLGQQDDPADPLQGAAGPAPGDRMTGLDDLGGEAKLRSLVETFYDLIETLPEGSNLRRLHARGHGIDHARVEQFNFLSGFLGGRSYYLEKHGHMDVKLMHAHVPIRQTDAENWLFCMNEALDAEMHQGPHVEKLRGVFARVARVLINDVADWEDW